MPRRASVMDPRWLAADFPQLFHVSEAGAWESIRVHGILSTSALLDRYGMEGAARHELESSHRPESVLLAHADYPSVVLRDQKPLSVKALADCLEDGMTVEEWLRLLNSKVFFWPTRQRLDALLGAAAYRDREHDVLTVDTRPFVERYASRITLTRINSGATGRARAPRGHRTFRPLSLYPEEPMERRRIAEIAVDHAVPDVADFVLRVERRRGGEITAQIWP